MEENKEKKKDNWEYIGLDDEYFDILVIDLLHVIFGKNGED